MAYDDKKPGLYDPESRLNESQEEVVKPLRSWKGYIWDTWELPQDQRWLLFKLDAFILTFASVSLPEKDPYTLNSPISYLAYHYACLECNRVVLSLTFQGCLAQIGYFLKNIDLTNVNNAYLSGMKEDLSMYGEQLVTSTSIYTVGYVIGQIPSNLLLTRVSPRWVIPTVCATRIGRQLHLSADL